MKSTRKIILATGLIGILTPAFALLALPRQVPSQQPGPRPPAHGQSDAQVKITVNSNLVLLPVTVKDGSGNLVPDLRKEEFRIFEDNIEQKVDLFTAEAFPLSLVILIDNDLKDKDAEEVQPSLDAILAGMSTSDEAFVCRFDEFFHPGKGFTIDQDDLLTQLHRTKLDKEPSVAPPGGPFYGPSINGHSAVDQSAITPSARLIKGQPTKALDDAVYAADQLLSDRGRDRRKVILLISDGVNGGKKFNHNTYDTVLKALLHDNVSVYSVAVASAFLDRKFSRLADYAHHSGGDIYYSAKRETLERLYSQVTEEARNQYTLGYMPQGTDRGKDYHSVEVRVRREGLTITTRQGYVTGAVAGTPAQ